MPARIHKGFFTKVHVAREQLRARADEIITKYMEIAEEARAAGDFKTAIAALQWMAEHLPAEDDGTRLLDASVDVKQTDDRRKFDPPAIRIGIQVGGIGAEQKALPKAEVVDAETDK